MKTHRWLAVLWAMQVLHAPHLQASEAWPEADIKAAFVFNFSLLTEWPKPPESEYLVCQFKNDSIHINNTFFQQKMLNGRPLKWMQVEHADELKKCHIALIGQYKAQEMESILNVLDNSPVLTVSDSSSPIAQKAMIRMVLENGLLGFEVNLKASKAANLQLSVKLLKLAKRVSS